MTSATRSSALTPTPVSGSIYPGILHGLVLCCTGFTREEKINIKVTTISLGGTFVDGVDLIALRVTHLLANTVDSEKYEHAVASRSIKVVRLDWLLDSKAQNKLLDERKYPFSEFSHVVICTTGYMVTERDTVIDNQLPVFS